MLSTTVQSCHVPYRCTACRATEPRITIPNTFAITCMGQFCAKRRRERCKTQCVPGCIFCRVVKESSKPGSRVVYEDDLVIALPDIRPAAVEHLLVIPREHVPNVSSLTPADVQLVRHMQSVGQQLLQQRVPQHTHPQPSQRQELRMLPLHQQQQRQQQQQQQLSLFKFGFHKPPFRSVDHLHLHCFMLPHKWYRWAQYQSSLNWITTDELIDELQRKPSRQQQQHLVGGQQQQQTNDGATVSSHHKC